MYTMKFNLIFDSLGSHRKEEQKEIMRGHDVCMSQVSDEIVNIYNS